MIQGGYYKRWRKELDSEIWEMDPLYLKVWDWILASVDYETGTLTTTLRLMAEAVAWTYRGCPRIPSKQTLIDILDWMQEKGMTERRTDGEGNAKYTKVTVLNWHTYQSGETTKGTQEMPRRERSGYPLEEVQETKEPPHPAPAPTRETGGDLGEELGGEEQRPEVEAGPYPTFPEKIKLRFAKPPASDTKANLRNAGFGYDSATQTWMAPDTPRARELAERYRPYLVFDTPQAAAAVAVPPPAPKPAQQPEPTPMALPPTPAHLQPVLDLIRNQIRPKSWETWFAPCTLTMGAAGLQVWTPSQIIADWIDKHYRPDLETACQQVLGRVPAIEIRVPATTFSVEEEAK